MDMYDWRRHKREQYKGSIDIMVNVIKESKIEKRSYNAETVDISEGGIGVVMDTPLEPGFVRFRDRNENKGGMVMWNQKLENSKYRVGIQFEQLFYTGTAADS